LGDSHPDTHYYLLLRGDDYLYSDTGDWSRTWDLWSYQLQLQQHHLAPMSLPIGVTFFAFYDALDVMVEDLEEGLEEGRQWQMDFHPTIEQVVSVLNRAVYEAERFENFLVK
jgi:hypothetical protein